MLMFDALCDIVGHTLASIWASRSKSLRTNSQYDKVWHIASLTKKNVSSIVHVFGTSARLLCAASFGVTDVTASAGSERLVEK